LEIYSEKKFRPSLSSERETFKEGVAWYRLAMPLFEMLLMGCLFHRPEHQAVALVAQIQASGEVVLVEAAVRAQTPPEGETLTQLETH